MVNPYALNASSYKPVPTKQIVLGQSNALKRFEKIQAKHTASAERRSGSPGKNRKNSRYSMDSYGIDDDDDDNEKSRADDDDDEDEDSLFKNVRKNANKFMKQKPAETGKAAQQHKKANKKYAEVEYNEELTDSQQSDLEISVMDRSSTPLAVKQRQTQIRPSSKTSSRLGATSAVSSVSSMKSTHKRSQSKVKFMKTGRHNETITDQENEDEAESTIIEDLMNNLMNIDDLEQRLTAAVSLNRL